MRSFKLVAAARFVALLCIASPLCGLSGESRAESRSGHDPGPKSGSMFELPRGRFTLRPGLAEMCLEVLPEHRLRLTFQGPDDRKPVVLDGPYVVTATKMGSYHFKLTVETIRHKTLSACRKYWVDEELPSTLRLDTEIRKGATLRFTANFGCAQGHDRVQLCLHDGGADGKRVICRDLVNEESECKEGPAIDGALINPPAAPLRSPPKNSPKNPPINSDAQPSQAPSQAP
jgi:hypothetical protein